MFPFECELQLWLSTHSPSRLARHHRSLLRTKSINYHSVELCILFFFFSFLCEHRKIRIHSNVTHSQFTLCSDSIVFVCAHSISWFNSYISHRLKCRQSTSLALIPSLSHTFFCAIIIIATVFLSLLFSSSIFINDAIYGNCSTFHKMWKIQKVYQMHARDWCAITNSTLRYVAFIKKEKQMPINNNAHNAHPIDFENNKIFYLSIWAKHTHSHTHIQLQSSSN